ncbi:unnamed protein product [Callosobruchus maculatus]|uniref:Uncharacterized protein n=1 Tax=Callosobruchus maculatus TaxID=64391 RepID=A0A653BZG8_CALMS|nr:unnamed protein product [Callosobruchus maculatus]
MLAKINDWKVLEWLGCNFATTKTVYITITECNNGQNNKHLLTKLFIMWFQYERRPLGSRFPIRQTPFFSPVCTMSTSHHGDTSYGTVKVLSPPSQR